MALSEINFRDIVSISVWLDQNIRPSAKKITAKK